MWEFEEDAALDVAKMFCDMSLAKLEWHSGSSESGENPGLWYMIYCSISVGERQKQGRSCDIGIRSC